MTNPIRKVAVDQDAKSYWEELFGPYGKLLSRDIPLKVKKALKAELAITARTAAAAGLQVVEPDLASAQVVHLASAQHENGNLVFDGAISSSSLKRLFTAELSKEGEVVSFTSVSV